ncbi:hypothetical protein HMPREF3216_00110 [Gardnerella vaginalis]|uniref:Uncharacterized protein n=1 Tax=Gardnerella vaginalis TaxID=2702 RepID=A0A133NSS8_GARVA|nr:hypothetical protein HMPREF3216_00110 [Gardnerella vaginalis]
MHAEYVTNMLNTARYASRYSNINQIKSGVKSHPKSRFYTT